MNRLTIALLLGSSLVAVACSREEPPPRAEVSAAGARQQSSSATDSAPLYVQQEKDRFVRAARQELDQLKVRLASLDSAAQAASGDAKVRLTAQVAELRGKLNEAETNLAQLNAAGAEGWHEAQASFSREMQALKQSFEREREQGGQG